MDVHELIDNEVHGDSVLTARGRLAAVFVLIEHRRAALDARAEAEGIAAPGIRYDGPASVLHVRNLPGLLDDDECRATIEHLVRHGARCGVVARVYGLPGEVVAALDADEVFRAGEALHGSTAVAAALMEGRVLQVAATPAPPPMLLQRPEDDDEARFYSEALSAQLWAALLLEKHSEVVEVFGHLRSLGAIPGGPADRRIVADALRRAADTLLPGSGGMIAAGIPCPLCLASPVFRPDEIPSHLVKAHARLAEGVRS